MSLCMCFVLQYQTDLVVLSPYPIPSRLYIHLMQPQKDAQDRPKPRLETGFLDPIERIVKGAMERRNASGRLAVHWSSAARLRLAYRTIDCL